MSTIKAAFLGPLTASNTATIVDPATPSGGIARMNPLVSYSAQNTTSGTAITFLNIPPWARRLTLMFNGVSTNGTSNWLVRLGTSGGIATTGYLGSGSYNGATNAGGNSTAGFIFIIGGIAQTMHGSMIITLLDVSANRWVQQGVLGDSSQAYCFFSGGNVALSGTLTQLQLTTVNGTDAFDAGSVNLMYE